MEIQRVKDHKGNDTDETAIILSPYQLRMLLNNERDSEIEHKITMYVRENFPELASSRISWQPQTPRPEMGSFHNEWRDYAAQVVGMGLGACTGTNTTS